MNPVDVLNQIKRLTTDVIAVGICDEQNFPSIKSYTGNISEIGVSFSDNSIFLKNVPYREMYSELVKKRNYKGLSQILCKRRNAVQIEQNLFKAEVAQAAAALFSK